LRIFPTRPAFVDRVYGGPVEILLRSLA